MPDAREIAAKDMHDKLGKLQAKSLWYLSRFLGESELANILYDFLIANGEQVPDHETIKDVISFNYLR